MLPKINWSSKVLVILMLAIPLSLIAGGLALLARIRLADASPHDSSDAPGTLPTSVSALGRLQPEGGVITIGSPLADRLRSVVQEGEQVKEGKELARLDSYDARKAEFDLVDSQLHEAQAQLAALEVSTAKQLAEADLHVRQARELGPLDVAPLKEKVDLLTKQRDSAVTDLGRLKDLTRPDTVSRQELEHQELAVRQAETELAAAEAALQKAKRNSELTLLAATAQQEALKAKLEEARKQIPLESLQQRRRLAEEQWKQTVIRAPADGQVLEVLARPGEVVGTSPILQLGRTQQMVVIAEVYETQIGNVHMGQQARITKKAVFEEEGGELAGTVVRIGNLIAKNSVLDIDPAADADSRVFKVKIRLDASTSTRASRYVNAQVKVLFVADSPAQP